MTVDTRTGRTFEARHRHPTARTRCAGVLEEFVVTEPPAMGETWVFCASCGTCGELAAKPVRRSPTRRKGDRDPIDLGDVLHGTHFGYRLGCRCHPCTDANSAEQRAERYEAKLADLRASLR